MGYISKEEYAALKKACAEISRFYLFDADATYYIISDKVAWETFNNYSRTMVWNTRVGHKQVSGCYEPDSYPALVSYSLLDGDCGPDYMDCEYVYHDDVNSMKEALDNA